MKPSRILTLILLLFTCLISNAQVDAIKIASAKKAIENKDYTIALQTLSDVSDKGKKNKLYLFYKGEAFYNLMEYDSAEVYYKKYFILDINNTDVADKLADIDYKRKKGFKQVAIELLISQLNNKEVIEGTSKYIYKVTNESLIKESYDKRHNNKFICKERIYLNEILKLTDLFLDEAPISFEIQTNEKKVKLTHWDNTNDYYSELLIDGFDRINSSLIYSTLQKIIFYNNK